jgi:multidrug resistance efflux pump
MKHEQVARTLKRILALALVAIVAVFATPRLLRALQSEAAAEAETARVLTVDALEVALEDGYDVPRRFAGQVRARRVTTLGFERTDQITELAPEEGSRVEAGALLARLDTRTLEAQRDQLEASLDAARARLAELEQGPREESLAAAAARVVELERLAELARLVERRRAELAADSNASEEDADRSRLEARAAEAQLEQAREALRELENGTRVEVLAAERARVAEFEARLAELDVALDKSRLTAPFAGVVSDVYYEVGSVTASLQPVLRLIEAEPLEAWIGLPAKHLANYPEGLRGEVQIGGRGYPARLRTTLPELDPTTRLRIGIFELEGAQLGDVAPGELARWTDTERVDERGMWLASSALVRSRRGLWAAYALAPVEGTADHFVLERRELELLHGEGERVFVRGPLAEGELVLASGAHRVANGQLVTRAKGVSR